jgi:solute:Na+ symporter, SSS family
MNSLLSTTDLVIFFGSLVAIMGVGLWVGRKENSSEDYFLAGKTTRWWGVAGSIFGSNVSANHIVGMMGVGFAVGFAQSHFEITAIAGLLMLCYFFLPVYRKLNVYTLSDYLSKRYDDKSRVSYALIMVVIMVVIQMVPGFYIGSRSINLLLQGNEQARAEAVVDESGSLSSIKVTNPGSGYASAPRVEIAPPPDKNASNVASASTVLNSKDGLDQITVSKGGLGYDPKHPPKVTLKGGASFNSELNPTDVDPKWYVIGILVMAFVTGAYVILGGLKAVIVTDVIQSVLLLLAGLLVAFITFSQPEIGGWAGMAARDLGEGGADRLHLYKSTDNPALPWTGVLSGLMVLHFYYWGTNQFIVQRALSAKSGKEARTGIIVAGFFKLLIPFFSIGTGMAAFYLFNDRNIDVAQDAVFMKLLTELIAPIGFGLVGLIAAGMIGAILSSLDSMMNSAATIMTFDIYKKFVNPEADEKRLVLIGRIWIAIFIISAAFLTIFTMDPNSKESFFLHVASHQGRLIAGVVVAFAVGMLWKRASAAGAVVAIVAGVALSYGIPPIYDNYIGSAQMKDVTISMIETDGTHGLTTGQPVRLRSYGQAPVSSPILKHDQDYFVSEHNASTLTLHSNLPDAKIGRNAVEFVTLGKDDQFIYPAEKATIVGLLNIKLNFLHTVFLAALISLILHIAISLRTQPDEEKGKLTWTGLGIFSPAQLVVFGKTLLLSLIIYGLLGALVALKTIEPLIGACIGAAWTFGCFYLAAQLKAKETGSPVYKEDRFWAGGLASCAIFMMYYFF